MFDKELKVGSNELELVDFRFYKEENGKITEEIYGINVIKVREIIEVPEITEIPNSPDFLEGIIDLRGVVIPIINLAKYLKIKEPDNLNLRKKIIIAEFNNILLGFIVHSTKRIRRISWENIQPISVEVNKNNYVTGITRIEDGKILLIIDLETIIDEMGFLEKNMNIKNLDEKFQGLVLLVDDSLTARNIERKALEHLGFEVIEAKNGEEGLQKLEELYAVYGDKIKEKIKLILSDIEMPKMDGYHMAAKIHQDKRFNGIPLLFSTSINDVFGIEKGEKVGAQGYLVKFDAEKLYNKIKEILHK